MPSKRDSIVMETVGSIIGHREQIKRLEQETGQEEEAYINLIMGRGVARVLYGVGKEGDSEGIHYGLYNPYVIAR